ncbi:hypothetical protein BH11ARM2_BH11ARM2_03950 [soil metagenome]
MKTVRKAFSWVALALLGGGYLGAMVMALTGRAAEWAEKMDQPPIRFLALFLLVAAVVCAFVPDREAEA